MCSSSEESDAQILETLEALIDKSLLRGEEEIGGEPRFSMLETIREYAAECLAVSGEEEAVRARHAAFFTELGEQAESGLHSYTVKAIDRAGNTSAASEALTVIVDKSP